MDTDVSSFGNYLEIVLTLKDCFNNSFYRFVQIYNACFEFLPFNRDVISLEVQHGHNRGITRGNIFIREALPFSLFLFLSRTSFLALP